MENILKEFIELVSIGSASGKEKAISDVLRKKLEDIGFSVREDDAGSSFGGECGNLIATLEGKLPYNLAFCSHMDRVAYGYDIKPVIKDNKIVSDGTTILAADDVSGICAILDGIRRALDSKKDLPTIEVILTVGEEANLWGGRYLDLSKIKSKLCYVLDSPGSIGRVVNGAPGRSSLEVEVIGKPAHAGNEPEKGINAAHILCHILDTLKDGRIDFETVSNFPIISTNCKAANVVCEIANAKGEARSRDVNKLDKYCEYFQKHCEEAVQGTGAKVKTKVTRSFSPFYIDEDAPIIVIAEEALSTLGLDTRIEQGGGGMDGNFYNERGLPALGVATGYFKNHTKDEYLELDSFLKSGLLVEELINSFIKYSENSK